MKEGIRVEERRVGSDQAMHSSSARRKTTSPGHCTPAAALRGCRLENPLSNSKGKLESVSRAERF